MKILLSFYNGVYSELDSFRIPIFYEAFSTGLSDLGNEVLIHHNKLSGEQCQDVCEETIEKIRRFGPELVVAFNNHGPDWTTIVDCPVCIYEVDSALYYSNVAAIRRHPDLYTYLILQQESKDYLVNHYGVDPSRLHFTRNFTAIKAVRSEKKHRISFLGSRFHGNFDFPWLVFQKGRPDDRSRGAYKELLREILKNPFMLPQECDAYCDDEGIPRQSVPELVMALSSAKRIKILSAVSDLGLDLFGSADWISSGGEDPGLLLSYGHEGYYSLEDNQRLYNSSQICLNVSHVQAVNTFPWRVLDIMASDGCLVMDESPEFSRLFGKLGVPMFRNGFEAHEHCSYLLRNPSCRDDVVVRCNEEINANWRFGRVVEVLEYALNVKLRNENSFGGAVSFVSDTQIEHRLSCAERLKKNRKVRALYYAALLAIAQVPGCGKLGKRAISGIVSLKRP